MKRLIIIFVVVLLLILVVATPVSADIPPWPLGPIPPDGYYSVYEITLFLNAHLMTVSIIPGILFTDNLPCWILGSNPVGLKYFDSDSRSYRMAIIKAPFLLDGHTPLKLVEIVDPNTGLTVAIQGGK